MHKALLSYAKHASKTFHVAIAPCSWLRPYLVQHHVMGIVSMTRWLHCALYNALVTHPRHPCFCDNAMSCPRSALVMAANMVLGLWPIYLSRCTRFRTLVLVLERKRLAS